MFFEPSHSLDENEFKLSENKSITFPIHIHRSFEYFEQVYGSTEVTVGSKKYVLNAGDAALIFPLQPHSYASIERGRFKICIFSPEMVSSFYKKSNNMIPVNNQFRFSLPENITLDNIFHQKSLSYLICGEFERCREYIEDTDKNGDKLLISLLSFAEQNFSNDCLLRDAAAKIGYDYAYVSKFFKRKTDMSFRQYVNRLRIIEGKKLLSSTADSVEHVAYACGFSSLRAFDREFFAQIGVTPSAYRFSKKSTTV